MQAVRKRFLVAQGLEDSYVTQLRRYINEERFWLEKARLEAGPDSIRYTCCELKINTLTLALGEFIRGKRMGMDSGSKVMPGVLDPATSLHEGNNYLTKVLAEGQPEDTPPGHVRMIDHQEVVHYVNTWDDENRRNPLRPYSRCGRFPRELTTNAVDCSSCTSYVGV